MLICNKGGEGKLCGQHSSQISQNISHMSSAMPCSSLTVQSRLSFICSLEAWPSIEGGSANLLGRTFKSFVVEKI